MKSKRNVITQKKQRETATRKCADLQLSATHEAVPGPANLEVSVMNPMTHLIRA